MKQTNKQTKQTNPKTIGEKQVINLADYWLIYDTKCSFHWKHINMPLLFWYVYLSLLSKRRHILKNVMKSAIFITITESISHCYAALCCPTGKNLPAITFLLP